MFRHFCESRRAQGWLIIIITIYTLSLSFRATTVIYRVDRVRSAVHVKGKKSTMLIY